MRIAIVANSRQWSDRTGPQRAMAVGLQSAGHRVEVVAPGDWPVLAAEPEAAFVWNGIGGKRGLIVAELRKRRIPVLIMERGFFDRFRHTQIDHRGFNHTSSWAARLEEPCPADGASRLAAVWGPCKPVGPRQNGHILVLLQVDGDTQLRDSEIRHCGPFVRVVRDAIPRGVEIRIRAHPRSNWRIGAGGRATMTRAPLKEAVADARFVVTINSGAANETLAWGCPVLCLGPAPYAIAGAALRTSLADLPTRMNLMLRGCHPARPVIENYLRWLACRQWSRIQLQSPHVVEPLLQAAREELSHEL